MFLKRLTISSVSGVIREIPFKRGLNLIVDESATSDTEKDTESGNSIGKTTLLRVVDFCFGSEGKDIYTDSEFNTVNQEIVNFLNDKAVTFTLEIESGDDIVVLERSFSQPVTLKINGEDYSTETEYKKKLEKLLFGINDSKPSLRQLMPKFIRKDQLSMSKTLKYLHSSTTDDDYEVIFFFLFGFKDPQLLTERYLHKKSIKALKLRLRTYKNGKSVVALREALKVVERDILKTERKAKIYDITEAYENELGKLNVIKSKIASLTSDITNLDINISLNDETLKELKNTKSKIDPVTIKELYDEANVFLPDLQKSFEDVLVFHNQLLTKKIAYIESSLGVIKKQVIEKVRARKVLLAEEGEILAVLASKNTMSDAQFIQKELNNLYEKKGQENKVLEIINNLNEEIKQEEDILRELDTEVLKHLESFEGNVSVFNIFFSEYSTRLYEEEYILSYSDDTEKTEFKIDNVKGNVGGGKKKAQVAALDLAYISFLDSMNSNLPRFVMHDSIEDVYYKQINTLFSIANEINGQYFVTILSEKLVTFGEEFRFSNKILSLSENDKFFRF